MSPPREARTSRFPLGLDQVGRQPGAAARPAAGKPGAPAAPSAATAVAKAVATAAAPAAGAGMPSLPSAPVRSLIRPQRLLHEAARDAARHAAPQGLGMDSAQVRHRMVERLQRGGLRHERVSEAFRQVPRHLFVDTALATQAYEDTSLPIGHGQTISKPSVVARMVELLFDSAQARACGHLGRTLEVGTGCGYQTALLALLAQRVVSIERLKPLHDKARQHLAAWPLNHVRLLHGDGMLGQATHGPYDSIIAAAGGEHLPPAWLDQLAVGGRLVAPLQRGRGQVLLVVDRQEKGCVHTEHEAVLFVPLKSGVV